MRRELIIGQRRVVGLLTFLLTPFALIVVPADVWVVFGLGATAGIALLFAYQLRPVGIGLLAGTLATFAGLLLLGAMIAGAD